MSSLILIRQFINYSGKHFKTMKNYNCGTFHNQHALEYGTKLVGCIFPIKGGTTHLGLPVFASVAEAKNATDPHATVVYVPPPGAAAAIIAVLQARHFFDWLHNRNCALHDMVHVKHAMLKQSKSRLVRPDCPGSSHQKGYKNIRYKNEQYKYPCDICGKHFKTKSVLNIHKLIHSGEKPHKCDLCEKRFAQATALTQHMRTHTGEKPYKCKYCERCFATKSILNKHLRGIHLGDNIHRCKFCPLAFRFASELRLHTNTHKDEDPETRERNMEALMEMEAKLKQQTFQRYKNKRNKNNRYPCDICGKHFKTTWKLNIHKRIHSGEKPHKCDFCEKRFTHYTTLSQHMRTHTGEKPYKCKYCERCFATKSVLNKHLRGIHLIDNIHRCKFCPLAFSFALELRLHTNTHKDEDPETRERNLKALMEIEAKLKQQALKRKVLT
ncbi:zinc finger protein 595-like isoform X4 [Eurosta solidaginis]|uniref:zinc finger protein 595-like isoform X4 n=1 Tax=Eurosta solidaginis TaxID=178769 RepID=UPI0035311562